MDLASCAQTDPEAFFPPKNGSARDAKKVCAACPVAAECLEYALRSGETYGVWGGLAGRELRRLPGWRRPSSWPQERSQAMQERVEALAAQGLGASEIARELGVQQPAVSKRLGRAS